MESAIMNITGLLAGRGGSRKTTTADAMHTWLNGHHGKYKPLLIDYDQQGNSSFTYGLDIDNLPTLYHVFNGDISIQEAIQHTPNGDIICGNASLNLIENQLTADNPQNITLLRDKLQELSKVYTHIIIDTPPKIQGIIPTQVMAAATSIVIPIISDAYSIQGLTRISKVAVPIKQNYNPGLRFDGVLLTKYHGFIFHRSIKKVAEQWAAQNDSRVYKTTIRECVQVQEAQGERQSLWEYAPRCTTARSYHAFMKEYLERNP